MRIPKVSSPIAKIGSLSPGSYDRRVNSRMELAIEADDQTFVKDRRGVVEPIVPVDLGKPHDCRDAIARKRCQHCFQVSGVDGDGGGWGA